MALSKGGDKVKKSMSKKIKRICQLLLVCLVALLFPMSTFAAPTQEETDTSLTIKYILPDTEFSFYKIADFSETGIFSLTEDFRAYGEQIGLNILEDAPEKMTTDTWRGMAISLESVIVRDGVEPAFSSVTDEDGQIYIANIEKGLYLIMGEMGEDDEHTYNPSAVLVCVPNRDEPGQWDSHPVIEHNKVDVDNKYEEYKVIKIWNDEGNENKRLKEIIVSLYMDGSSEPYDIVKLNEDNNWEYIWTNLPIGHSWTVAEEEVENYTVEYGVEGNVFSIKNTYQGPETPSEEPLPQTGQLWWPVPILAMLGIALFTLGWVRRTSGDR